MTKEENLHDIPLHDNNNKTTTPDVTPLCNINIPHMRTRN